MPSLTPNTFSGNFSVMPVDYKDTLNLPQTDFPMKANLNQREPEILKLWEEKSIYRRLQEKNKGNKSFILHDGPPYANGNIHIGHALNKILKDIIVNIDQCRDIILLLSPDGTATVFP